MYIENHTIFCLMLLMRSSIILDLPSGPEPTIWLGLGNESRFAGDGKLLNRLELNIGCWLPTSKISSSELLFSASDVLPKKELFACWRLDGTLECRVGREFFRTWECDLLLEDDLTVGLFSMLFPDCLSLLVSSVNP